ncbi:TetR/AcrR family transcriptional regulator [Levilactobacillus tongjiangensis]|uniref:TetR/AcrR family transcriptional regulator n=1 Tax=Levilactobacillus tongjiangensis TaxID=2486023 RepID=A0ABW1SPR0_9LACO|nr:TetR/AcrR family transcriptional regulator [Levilactobacillus tongjiangensis]
MATNQERKQRQRQSILAAGMKLFMRDGYKPTHIKAVAAEAGVSQVTLYKYFDSKLELGHQVVIDLINQGYASFRETVDNQQMSFTEVVKWMMTTKVAMSDGLNPDFYSFVIDEMQGNLGSHAVKDAYEAGKKEFWDAMVARGRAAGSINPQISNEALMLFLDMYVDFFSRAKVGPDEYQHLVDQLMHLFFYGLVGGPVPPKPDQSSKEDQA